MCDFDNFARCLTETRLDVARPTSFTIASFVGSLDKNDGIAYITGEIQTVVARYIKKQHQAELTHRKCSVVCRETADR